MLIVAKILISLVTSSLVMFGGTGIICQVRSSASPRTGVTVTIPAQGGIAITRTYRDDHGILKLHSLFYENQGAEVTFQDDEHFQLEEVKTDKNTLICEF